VNRLLLFLARGFGIGQMPVAPGTFGSLAGMLWFAILLQSKNFPVLLGGTIVGVALSVWLCGEGEKILNQKDPGSIVFDEIAAMPVCFLSWTVIVTGKAGLVPPFDYFFSGQNWLLTLGVFAAFRFFDVAKPWPVRQSQSLPGGWGVTIDDMLAAIYVNALVLAIYAVHMVVVQ
jgi:phosphatidylglycerophosphatase A